MQPADLRIPVAGGHLAIRDHGGTGRHVVLIHDVGDNCTQWDKLAPLLARHARVLSIDLRGHGQTTATLHHLDQLLDDFAAMAKLLAIERFVLVGHHWGGNVGALLADHHPDLVDALCVIDSPIMLPALQYRELLDYISQESVIDSVVERLALGVTGVGEVQLGNFVDATSAVVANDWLNPPMTSAEAESLIRRSIHHGPGELWARVPTRETVVSYVRGALGVRPFTLERFAEEPWPVWILQPADGDYTSGVKMLDELAGRLPGWAAEQIPGGSHCWFTHPRAVCDTLSYLLSVLPERR